MTGLGYNSAESLKAVEERTMQATLKRPTQNEPPRDKIRKINNKCFACNKYGHMKKDCKGNIHPNHSLVIILIVFYMGTSHMSANLNQIRGHMRDLTLDLMLEGL